MTFPHALTALPHLASLATAFHRLQELSDIANNAGQPELVYKLMELSTASAVWNTRKGVAFALAGQSRARLDAHLEKLIPTLYRYTFDPNPRIVQAMKQVCARHSWPTRSATSPVPPPQPPSTVASIAPIHKSPIHS